jgi:hypothetical protein
LPPGRIEFLNQGPAAQNGAVVLGRSGKYTDVPARKEVVDSEGEIVNR